MASVTGVRHAVATQPVHRPGSGPPAVGCPARPVSRPSGAQPLRCPVTRVRRPGSGDPAGCRPPVRCPPRLLSTRAVSSPPVSSPLLSTHPASSRLLSACPSGRVRLLPSPAVALGPGSGGRATVTTATGRGPGGWPRRRAAGRRPSSPEGRATPPRSRGDQSGGRWRTRARLGAGGGRPCPLRDQAGQAGVRSARWLAAARWGRGAGLSVGWPQRPGGWRPRARWATTVSGGLVAARQGGRPLGVPAGTGVRPQRGPGRQGAFPAGCRQRCDLRRWLVGLPGLEPGTSSLSGIEG